MKLVNTKLVAATATDAPTNHIVVVDCSGSMSGELPKIRTHLKNKIPTLVKPDDTLTVIWFSGKNEYGVLFERVEVHGLVDLSNINSTIDRYLTTVGLTGFKQPLEEVLAVINRSTDIQHSMIFMSDGYDNSWSKNQIIDACKNLGDSLVSACFVEYGHYADHETLMDMSQEVGGSLVQATDFSKYAFHLDNLKNLSFGKRIKATITGAATGFEFAVGHSDVGFTISKIVNGEAAFPSNTTSYSYLIGTGNSIDSIEDAKTACAVVAALVQRGSADIAVDLAALIGDVTLYSSIQNAFSKQDYAKVVDVAEQFAIGSKSLYSDAPKNTGLTQDPNAYNVLQLLFDLSNNEGNSLVISHPDFKYNSIGAKRTPVEIDGFIPKFSDTSDTVVAQISNLTFDGDRPNVSILVKRHGSVTLPENDYGFGTSFNTFIWRNYSFVRDGIVNVEKMPVQLTKATYDIITDKGIDLGEYKIGKVFVIDISKMPVINRAMVSGVTAEWIFRKSYDEYVLECQQKYVKTLMETADAGEKFSAMYGEEAAVFLKKYGISEGGFSQKTESGEAADSYIAKVLSVKLAGMSSVPKISDVVAAIEKGKTLTPGQETVSAAMKTVDEQISSGKTAEDVFSDIKSHLKALRTELVKAKFGVIIGRKWFIDLNGYDDTVRELDFGLAKKIKCEVVLSDKLV